jgi:hypothetical protein
MIARMLQYRIAVTLICTVALVVGIVSGISPVEYQESKTFVGGSLTYGYGRPGGSAQGNPQIYDISFADFQSMTGFQFIAATFPASATYLSSLSGYPDDGVTPVTGKIGNDIIFTGQMGYNIVRDGDGSIINTIIWIDNVENFQTYAYTGTQRVTLEWDTTKVPRIRSKFRITGWSTQDSNAIFLATPVCFVSKTNERVYATTSYLLIEEAWQVTINVAYNAADGYDIGLFRSGSSSTITIQSVGSGALIYGNKSNTPALSVKIPPLYYPPGYPDLNISVFGENTSPPFYWLVSPTTSIPSHTTVYIRDSQTGALIPGARVVISDAASPMTEVVNQTLPDGTDSFSLPRADNLRYHASATASGYTLLSPILFGVPEGGTTIILWMAPDTPPDVPTDPEKSMLYGYILTQGNQQPISGATVSLDGYGSTTTSSTGFYLFNNIDPGQYTITASAPLHDALTEPVTVDPAATQHNLALKGHFMLTVTAKDDTSLANLHNATVSLSDGQESTQNPATFSADYGPYTITAAAGGYYPQTQSAYLDKPGTTTATVLLTARPEPVPPPEMPNYPPHNVKFTVQTLLGTPIPGVNVTAQGIQQTPSTNIIERLLGINMTTTPINSEIMTGTTDTNGEINFMMVEAVKYRISLYKPDVVDQTLEIYPKEDTYPIIISTAGGPLLPDAGDALRDIRINVTTSTEGDTGHIHIDYNDTTLKTTGLTIQVTQQNTTDSSAPEEVIASHTVANDANVTHTFDLSVYKGQSFFVRLEAEHPDFGTINRDYAVAFKGVRVPLGPLPDGLYIYVAGFGLMLLGGIFGATSATRGVVVIAFAGWLFWGFGWLDDLGLIAPVSLGLVSTIAVMGVIVTRYKEEGYT